MKPNRLLAPLLFAALAFSTEAADKPLMVSALPRGQKEWHEYETRDLDSLPSFKPAKHRPKLDRFGGLADRQYPATGFLRTQKVGDRWWIVDPEGHPMLHMALVRVAPIVSPTNETTFAKHFGNDATWAAKTTSFLREHGFNGLGAWSSTTALRAVEAPLVYTTNLDFMSGYGRKRGGTFVQPGHAGYPNDSIFVFDPGFETFCEERAQALADHKDDPYLLGYFSDNELPWRHNALDRFLELPESEAGRQAAQKWWETRQRDNATEQNPQGTRAITDADRDAFLGLIADRYYHIVSTAIRKYDPNHLFLGARHHPPDFDLEPLLRAAGRYIDVLSMNYYGAWTPSAERIKNWETWTGKPFLVTEWYVKGVDSGLGNTTGAGWIVKTQKDRGLFYEQFTLALLESRACVGWHWFRYMDNDPSHKEDPSNVDANKGVLTIQYEPYKPLLRSMKRLNEQVYSLIEYFDRGRP